MDSYIYIITALLPLSAAMVVFQTNPYHALVIRGILGAIAALTYTVLGAADVALTEALVGTLLAITLYAVAVRSSLVLRLGVLKDDVIAIEPEPEIEAEMVSQSSSPFQQLTNNLRTVFRKYHMRVELVPYQHPLELQQALIDKEVHATCSRAEPAADAVSEQQPYQTTTRVQRLFEIMQTDLVTSTSRLSYVNPADSGAKH